MCLSVSTALAAKPSMRAEAAVGAVGCRSAWSVLKVVLVAALAAVDETAGPRWAVLDEPALTALTALAPLMGC